MSAFQKRRIITAIANGRASASFEPGRTHSVITNCWKWRCFRPCPRRYTKPLAKAALKKFGSFAKVIHSPVARLREVEGIGEASINQIKLLAAAATRVAKGEVRRSIALSSWNDVIDYIRTGMAFADKEQFRRLLLDSAIN